jgi:hypothetical protein
VARAADLFGKLDILRVECAKCPRRGQYRVDRLVALIGRDGKLTDWLAEVAADCPLQDRRQLQAMRAA